MSHEKPEEGRFSLDTDASDSKRTELIDTLLHADNFWDRQKAAYGLASFTDAGVTEVLIESGMNDSMGAVRFGVMKVLMDREGEGIREAFEHARRHDCDPYVRDKAEEGLKRYEN